MARYMKSTGFAAALVAAALFGAFVAPQLVANADSSVAAPSDGDQPGPRVNPTYIRDDDGNVVMFTSPEFDRILAEREASARGETVPQAAPSGPAIGTITEDGAVPISSLSNASCAVATGCSLAVILSDAEGNLVPKIMTVQFYDMLPAE